MKAWLKGGLIGAGIIFITILMGMFANLLRGKILFHGGELTILTFFAIPFFWIFDYLDKIIHSSMLLNLVIYTALILIYFVIGALIGLIAGKIKNRKKNRK
ncbi:MAG: hypothetical protein PHH54_03895 [Candidatus Nanoarchaeia archaeon]|nr:hypothetical protein [Candidatus Nanoarchaeia archaeon]MDD5741102.1 hypothetical protein [Candidatus Nanoarchaeia archaeon]